MMSVRLMMVDDSRLVVEELRNKLQGSPFEIVGHCRDGESAAKLYAEIQPDLVTMDIILPGIDGFESAKQILALDPKAVIVFISSLAYDETIDQAKELGSPGFLFKPFERQRLLATLEEANHHRRANLKNAT